MTTLPIQLQSPFVIRHRKVIVCLWHYLGYLFVSAVGAGISYGLYLGGMSLID